MADVAPPIPAALTGAERLKSSRLIEASIDCRPGFSANGGGHFTIGEQVWIERGVSLLAHGGRITVLGGMTIGDGGASDAGAVVTHNPPANPVSLGGRPVSPANASLDRSSRAAARTHR